MAKIAARSGALRSSQAATILRSSGFHVDHPLGRDILCHNKKSRNCEPKVDFGCVNSAVENVFDTPHTVAMKTLILAVTILMIANSVVRSDEPAISVSVVVPKHIEGERRITWRNSGTVWDREAHFHAIVSNRSDKPQKIWMEGFSHA